MFSPDSRQRTLISDNLCFWGGGVVWDVSFKRDLSDTKVSDFASMVGKLGQVYILVSKSDIRLWKPVAKGKFSVKYFYNALIDSGVSVGGWNRFWGLSILPRVLAFHWVARILKFLIWTT